MRNPAALFRAGDTLFVDDWGLRRTTLWTLEGRAAGAMPASDALRGILPRAGDAAGRFYYEVSPRPGADGQGNRDSAVVVRAGAGAATAIDTIARLAPLDLAEVDGRRGAPVRAPGVQRLGPLGRRCPTARSGWRGSTRTGWSGAIPTGTWRRGEPLPDRVLEVTRYDRELFLRQLPARAERHRRAASVRARSSRRSRRRSPRRTARSGWRRAARRSTRPGATTWWTGAGGCAAEIRVPGPRTYRGGGDGRRARRRADAGRRASPSFAVPPAAGTVSRRTHRWLNGGLIA